MSDFLFCSRPVAHGSLSRHLERYLAATGARVAERHGPWGSLAVARAPHDPEPLIEDGAALSVLVGSPIVRGVAEGGGSGGTGAGRPGLRALLRAPDPVRWDQHLDGPFALLQLGPDGGGRVVSDLASFVPVFACSHGTGESLVLGTHLDCVAAAAGRSDRLDPVSAADLLINLTCTFPHTLFAGVEQFPPASSRRFGPSGGWQGRERAYWEPREESAFPSLPQAAEALRSALLEDVRAACEPHPRVAILLSGGEDARAVMAAVPPGPRVHAFVFADWENREVTVARRVARAHGAELTFGRRDPDHYPDGLEAVASLVGSGQLFMDVHGFRFHETLGIRDFPVVLGGLSSDAFLKAVHAPAGRAADEVKLPPAGMLRPDLVDEVQKRRTAFRERLRELRPESAAEWERLWPFSMRVHAANFHGNRRLFASHEPFHCNGVVRVAAGVPQRWKRRRALFHRAMRPLFAKTWHVPHSRWRFPYFGPYMNLPLTVGLRVGRGVRAVLTGQTRASHGPWPKWGRVVRSEATAARQARYPVEHSPLRSLFVAAPWDQVARSIRAEWHPLREMMLLQLSFLTSGAEQG